jgi:hypothetical protein
MLRHTPHFSFLSLDHLVGAGEERAADPEGRSDPFT